MRNVLREYINLINWTNVLIIILAVNLVLLFDGNNMSDFFKVNIAFFILTILSFIKSKYGR